MELKNERSQLNRVEAGAAKEESHYSSTHISTEEFWIGQSGWQCICTRLIDVRWLRIGWLQRWGVPPKTDEEHLAGDIQV